MATKEPRLRVVDTDHTVTGERADDELTEQQATVFAALVAQRDHFAWRPAQNSPEEIRQSIQGT